MTVTKTRQQINGTQLLQVLRDPRLALAGDGDQVRDTAFSDTAKRNDAQADRVRERFQLRLQFFG